jgi:hypothetical protein
MWDARITYIYEAPTTSSVWSWPASCSLGRLAGLACAVTSMTYALPRELLVIFSRGFRRECSAPPEANCAD